MSIGKSYFTIKGTTIIAMLHHLIILLALSILRPDTFHLKKFSQGIVFSYVLLYLCGHNQLVSQPFPVTLRKRKPLQVSPKIIQSKSCHRYCF